MLLSLKDSHKQHLEFLIKQPDQVLIDFCKLSLDYLHNGPNEKRYNVAAGKLEVNLEIIQKTVEGLVNLLLESCKNQLSENDFHDSVVTIGFSEDQAEILTQFYKSKENEITDVLPRFSVKSKHYCDLDWRFEVEVASRSLLKQVKPIVTMELTVQEKSDGYNSTRKSQGTEEKFFVQSDISNLHYLTQTLEEALAIVRTTQFKRIQRSLKQ